MRQMMRNVYGFLPVQLFVLHLRKYQLLLLFWVIIILVITGHFAKSFGAISLFLSPEYQGDVNITSMFLLGGALAMFTMSWHITTFIIHSKRVPFLGAAQHAFIKYCINNSLIPLGFLIFYCITYARFQWINEYTSAAQICLFLAAFIGGNIFIILISFIYFFRADRNILKVILSSITNPSLIREIIPYDSLDAEFDVLLAKTFLTAKLRIQTISELPRYNMRVMNTVLRRHHRNAIFATLFAIIMLLLLGAFMDNPAMRIPAAAGFLILFSVLLGISGAVKYFLRSWELLGWVLAFLLVSLLVSRQIIDFRGTATGISYEKNASGTFPLYNYDQLFQLMGPERRSQDLQNNLLCLEHWKSARERANGDTLPPLVIICASGGGSRAAYWTFRALQHADSLSAGRLFDHTVMMTGASGGMIGAAYWRSLHWKYKKGEIGNRYDAAFQKNIGKDILNAIIYSFVSIDLIAPFNNVTINGRTYRKDRGYAMEQELISNTGGVLDNTIGDFKTAEQDGSIPMMIFGNTIINDGRRLLISAQPLSHLSQPVREAQNDLPVIDAVDLYALFPQQHPEQLRITSALRMNATFPYILPVVKMPTIPAINIMDAGLRDNFGMETTMRYLQVFRDWMQHNSRRIIVLQIRDTKEHELFKPEEENSLVAMAMDPMTVIHNKWGTFQTYEQSYLKDMAKTSFGDRLRFISLEYIPAKEDHMAALNFHLTQKEKEDLYHAIDHPRNEAMLDSLVMLLGNSK